MHLHESMWVARSWRVRGLGCAPPAGVSAGMEHRLWTGLALTAPCCSTWTSVRSAGDPAEAFEAVGKRPLTTARRRGVVVAANELVGRVLLGHHAVGVVGRVAVADRVSQLLRARVV